MTDIGTIKMRAPGGRPSAITVSCAQDGTVDIHFSRTSEGEALMRLPVYAAKQLGELLLDAVTTATKESNMAIPMLQEHGTQLLRLKPSSIVSAAEADLKLRQKKKNKTAEPGALYSFARKHVQLANNAGSLIALAYFDPEAAASTDKKTTYVVYSDRDLLREALITVINSEPA